MQMLSDILVILRKSICNCLIDCRHCVSSVCRLPASANADNSAPRAKVKNLRLPLVGLLESKWPATDLRFPIAVVSAAAFFSFGLFQSFSAVLPHLFPQTLVGGTSVLLTLLLPPIDTWDRMARYSAFLGRRVEVQYRAGDILLPASGIFVADSGRSIFLEQNFEQRGRHSHFRWEIPYQCLVRIFEKPDSSTTPDAAAPAAAKPAAAPEVSHTSETDGEPRSAAAAASAGSAPVLVSLSRSSKTA